MYRFFEYLRFPRFPVPCDSSDVPFFFDNRVFPDFWSPANFSDVPLFLSNINVSGISWLCWTYYKPRIYKKLIFVAKNSQKITKKQERKRYRKKKKKLQHDLFFLLFLIFFAGDLPAISLEAPEHCFNWKSIHTPPRDFFRRRFAGDFRRGKKIAKK